MDNETAAQLIDSLESRFVSWRTFALVIIFAFVAAFSVPVGVAIYLVEAHAKTTHEGSVSQREFVFIDHRLERLEDKLDQIIGGQ